MKKKTAVFLAIALFFSGVPARAAHTVSAASYILIEASTGRVLAAKEENTQRPMASTTKIMTALLALEEENCHERFIVDSEAIRVEGTSMGLKEGDEASLYDLAGGMLAASGNDGANAAAVKIAGSIEAFAEKMNEKAAALSMHSTHFVTPSGLHDEAHYSTAADMALLARAALKNEDFAALCSQKSVQLYYGNPPYTRTLSNHNRLLSSYSGCIGVTNASFWPFEYTEGNQIVGFDISMSQYVAQHMGQKLEVVNMDFDALIGALQAGSIDFIAAGMSVTPDRLENVDFSDAYYESEQVIIVRK